MKISPALRYIDQHLIALPKFYEICPVTGKLVIPDPVPNGLKVCTPMLGIEVNKWTNLLHPPLSKNTGVKFAHQLLTKDVYTMAYVQVCKHVAPSADQRSTY